ncbi:hypothetical protein FA95DRAFT_616321 [Auriscalpium vulgare]|uniref:Uncharacterized protein n=1 Tax=Auriscalpium vulgare TaxID=40419 RepID=A0ACB8RER3_9AGAM|nr:hypothetical protein FA95DRAFT_616321 [Auriscalpium vulgare]
MASAEDQGMSESCVSTTVDEVQDLLRSWDTIAAFVLEDTTQAGLFVMPDPSAVADSGSGGTQQGDHNHLEDGDDDSDGSLFDRMPKSMFLSIFNDTIYRDNRTLDATEGDKATIVTKFSDRQHVFTAIEEINYVRLESERRKQQEHIEQSLFGTQSVGSLSVEQVGAYVSPGSSSRIRSWLRKCAQAQDSATAQRSETEQNPQVDPEEAPVHQYQDCALRTGSEEGDKSMQSVVDIHQRAERAQVEVACPATDIQHRGPAGKRDAHTWCWQTFVVCFATLIALTLLLLWWCNDLTPTTTSLAISH